MFLKEIYMEKYLETKELITILCGISMGTIARLITLKVDTRQNPSYPTGYFINIVLGVVASALGAVAIPSLLWREFTAVTFITLAIQSFRDIRKSEKESLQELEKTEYTKRGAAYIDGICKTYESRYYICLLTSFFVVLVLKLIHTEQIFLNILASLITGFTVVFFSICFTKGKCIGDICEIKEGMISFDHSDLLIDGMFISNVFGTEKSRELFLKEGTGFVITPKKPKFRLTFENYGQRQAILFEAARTFGIKRFSFTRRNFEEGKLLIAFVPIIRDPEGIMKVMKQTPVLENSRKVHTIMDTGIGGMLDE